MSFFPIQTPLAQDVMHLARDFQGDSAAFTIGDVLVVLAIIAGSIGMFLGLRFLRRRQDASRKQNNPAGLFRALCKLHALNGREKSLLKRLAADKAGKHPGQVFVRPELFAADAGVSAADASALGKLAHKLFGPPPSDGNEEILPA